MKHCLNCNTPLIKYATKYCNQSCQNDHAYKEYVKGWLAGTESGRKYEGEVSTHVRKWMLIQADHKCSKCSWSEVNPTSGRIPLTINHIDGNAENHRPENLEVLCPNCHSLTSNYGNLNRGNGRKKRLAKLKS